MTGEVYFGWLPRGALSARFFGNIGSRNYAQPEGRDVCGSCLRNSNLLAGASADFAESTTG
jgi:hypothetical protein